ncbi:hypothetical protein L0128_20580 [candidate division KSB1 bacterium]|nr:hypothetical protein [candidate division KSB1 bacterium]
MSVLQQIAFFQNRRDEVPNQTLARELVASQNHAGIQEIAENLWNKNRNIQADCLKVLYEVGYLAPALIADYVQDFLTLSKSKNNRIVWGSMITLATIAALKPQEIFSEFQEIQRIMATGSVITVDNGIKTLSIVASRHPDYQKVIFPFLLQHLRTCRPKDVPQHSEQIKLAASAAVKQELLEILQPRLSDLTPTQAARVRKVIRAVENL